MNWEQKLSVPELNRGSRRVGDRVSQLLLLEQISHVELEGRRIGRWLPSEPITTDFGSILLETVDQDFANLVVHHPILAR